MDFTTNTERLLLESMFWNWLQENVEGKGRQDLKEWYLTFSGSDKEIVSRWEAYAAGVIDGMELQERLQKLEATQRTPNT